MAASPRLAGDASQPGNASVRRSHGLAASADALHGSAVTLSGGDHAPAGRAGRVERARRAANSTRLLPPAFAGGRNDGNSGRLTPLLAALRSVLRRRLATVQRSGHAGTVRVHGLVLSLTEMECEQVSDCRGGRR